MKAGPCRPKIFDFLAHELPLLADDRRPSAADEHHGSRRPARSAGGAGQARRHLGFAAGAELVAECREYMRRIGSCFRGVWRADRNALLKPQAAASGRSLRLRLSRQGERFNHAITATSSFPRRYQSPPRASRPAARRSCRPPCGPCGRPPRSCGRSPRPARRRPTA